MVGFFKFQRARATDDLGKTVVLLRLDQGTFRDDPELAATVMHLNESISQDVRDRPLTFRHVIIALAVIGLVVAAIIGLIQISRAVGPLPFDRFLLPVLIVGFLVLQILYMQREFNKRHRQIVDSILRIGRCPCCGYDLRSLLPRSEDNVRVCTECGAGWSSSRVGTGTVAGALLPLRAEMPGDTAPVFANTFRFFTRSSPVVDDRGRAVPGSSIALKGLDSSIGSDRARQVRKAVRQQTERSRLGGVALTCSLTLFLFVLLVLGAFRRGSGTLIAVTMLAYVFPIVFLTLSAFRYWIGNTPKTAKKTAAILRAEGICASCLSDLGTLPREHDECVVCPRCSSAWKIGYGRAASSFNRNTTSV